MKRIIAVALTVSILLGAFVVVNNQAQPQSYKWCLIVYMCGDRNGLDGALSLDISEMSPNADTIVVALVDGNAQATVVEKGSLGINTLSPLDFGVALEPNMGDPETLITFVKAVLGAYESDHYMLDFWNHGQGFIGSVVDQNPKFDMLSEAEMKYAMRTIDHHFDVIGFDACYMAQLAVAYEFYPYCDYYIASEDTEPFNGWDYNFLANVTGTTTGKDFAISILDYYTGGTLSVVRSDQIKYLVSEFDALSNALLGDNPTVLTNAYSGCNVVVSQQISSLVDMGSFLGAISSTKAEVNNQRDDTITALNGAVVKAQGGDGLTLYFVPKGHIMDEGYLSYNVCRDTHYDELLLAYQTGLLQESIDLIIPVVIVVGNLASCQLPGGINAGWVEANVDGGGWFHGEESTTTDKHTLAVRYYDGLSYSEINVTEITGVSTVRTVEKSDTFTLTLQTGLNYISFPTDVDMTADQFLETYGATWISKRSDDRYVTYVKVAKNIADNFDLEPGIGYGIYTEQDITLTYSGVVVKADITLDEGWNLVGVTVPTTASRIAGLVSGGSTLVSVRGDSLKIYAEEVGVENFDIGLQEAVYIYAEYYQGVSL